MKIDLKSLDKGTMFNICVVDLQNWQKVTTTAMCMTSFPSLQQNLISLGYDFVLSPPTVHSNCSKRLWLHARAVLVTLENYSGWPGELSWLARGVELNLPDVRFLFLPLLPTPLPKRGYNAVSAVADEVWQYRTGGNLTIFDRDHDAMKDRSRVAEVLVAKHRRSLWLPCTAGGNQAKLNVYRIRNLRMGGWKLVMHMAVAVNAKFGAAAQE